MKILGPATSDGEKKNDDQGRVRRCGEERELKALLRDATRKKRRGRHQKKGENTKSHWPGKEISRAGVQEKRAQKETGVGEGASSP